MREIQAGNPNTSRNLDWFDSPLLKPVPNLPAEINLLSDYEDPLRGNIVDFWMEPSETYHVGRTLVLAPGQYLTKVTFIGAKGDDNFWSRVAMIAVQAGHGTQLHRSHTPEPRGAFGVESAHR